MRVMRLAVALGTMFSVASTALAQPMCGDAKELAGTLRKEFKEEPVVSGLSHSGNVVMFWAGAEKETFTVLVVTPDGRGGVVDAGELLHLKLPLKGQPAVF